MSQLDRSIDSLSEANFLTGLNTIAKKYGFGIEIDMETNTIQFKGSTDKEAELALIDEIEMIYGGIHV